MSDSNQDDVVEERIYTIPLRKAWIAPIKKRVPKGIRIIRAFIQKHMKVDDPKILPELNEFLWSRGIEGLPRKVRVRVTRDTEGLVSVHLVKGE